MKVLVTGAGGFLGSCLVRKLLEAGEREIRCFVRQESPRQDLIRLGEQYPGATVELYKGNLTSRVDVDEAIKGVEVIYHCAAAKKGSLADMFYNTVVASKNLLDSIRVGGIQRIVLVSSFSVYGVATLPRKACVNETTGLEGHPEKRDPYSYVKTKQENIFWDYHARFGIPLVVIRPGVIYGPDGVPLPARVGASLPGLFLHLGNGNTLPLTHVENCAEAIVLAGRTPGIAGEVFNIHDDDLPTSKEYLRYYKKKVRPIFSLSIPYPVFWGISLVYKKYVEYSRGQLPEVFTPYKTASMWKGNRFDNSKAKRMLNWRPSVSIRDGLRMYFEYLSSLPPSLH